MHIRRIVVNRVGDVLEGNNLMTVSDRVEAANEIQELQKEFDVSDYNFEQDYWWGRNNNGEFRLTKWFIDS
jgi:hypothetical protein